ncbi:MAG: AtpZ/AtpI family protein [Desulfobacterales bacterium]
MFFDPRQHKPWSESLSIVLQVGLTMAGCIVACFFAGRFLDQWMGTRGFMTVFMTLFGVVGGAVVCYRQVMETLRSGDESDSGPNHGRD